MSRGPSLRLRLVLLTTAAVAIVWLLAAVLTWHSALHEIEELLDHPPATAQHMNKERKELARDIAKHLLMPMLVALPGLAVVLAIAVGFSLRPLRRLATDVGARAPERLTPIDDNGVPGEIQPLIQRLNTLFADVERALANERRFTADASHELRTPLAALKAQAQVALAATGEVERRHALEQIVAGCDRTTRLVTQMLTLARLDADAGHAFGPLRLRALAEEVLAESAGAALARDCELVLDPGDGALQGSADLLRAALRNLVENALRHGDAHLVRVGIAPAADRLVLTVADDGRGIPASERAAVLQRFRRGADAQSHDATGSGLGLSIVHRIAELHGARMELADGSDGRGLTVRLDFPPAA